MAEPVIDADCMIDADFMITGASRIARPAMKPAAPASTTTVSRSDLQHVPSSLLRRASVRHGGPIEPRSAMDPGHEHADAECS